MRTILIGVAVFMAVAVTAGSVQAQGGRETREARRHMEEGQEFFLQERWEQASESFLAAFELRPHMAFLYNAALAMHRLGSVARAIELYRRYLDTAPNARDRSDVEQRIGLLERAAQGATDIPPPACEGEDCPQECQPDDENCDPEPPPRVSIELDPEAARAGRNARMKSVILVESEPANATVILVDENDREVTRGEAPLEYTADPGRYALRLEHPEYRSTRTPVQVTAGRYYIFHIEMSQPPAFLQVVTDPPGARVYLDDPDVGSVGSTPYGDVVRTGRHTLWVERAGYQPVEREIEIGLGQEEAFDIPLERLPFGEANILTNVEDARVEIDGEEIGVAPVRHQLPEGEHVLRVRSDGMKDFETPFTVSNGQSTRMLVRLNPRPSRTSAWVSLAFSALLFAGGGVAGWYSTTVYDDLEQAASNGRLAADDPRMQRGFIWALAADVSFLVATVTSALTLYYFLRDPLPPSEGRVEDPADFELNPEGYRVVAAATATPAPAAPAAQPVNSAPTPAEEPAGETAPPAPAAEPPAAAPTPIQPPSEPAPSAEGASLTPEEAEWLYDETAEETRRRRRARRRPRVSGSGGPFPGFVVRF